MLILSTWENINIFNGRETTHSEHQIQLATSAKQTFREQSCSYVQENCHTAVHELADMIPNFTGSAHLILCTVFQMKEVCWYWIQIVADWPNGVPGHCTIRTYMPFWRTHVMHFFTSLPLTTFMSSQYHYQISQSIQWKTPSFQNPPPPPPDSTRDEDNLSQPLWHPVSMASEMCYTFSTVQIRHLATLLLLPYK
jgi:hypothetical protein